MERSLIYLIQSRYSKFKVVKFIHVCKFSQSAGFYIHYPPSVRACSPSTTVPFIILVQ